ncbi:hypothetical protein H7F51_11240 [Novosphingobium flavum]|uniref:Uncharacterized protein n=1 Tax=Novosphingobium flavum TaxID=1778672 RepID=A0A7X1FSD4_9SPHN|nr:hypothetical protein [Novosphingobium flavum]MBC2666091.1 hypothetical protein [Novosphingobium flavum]
MLTIAMALGLATAPAAVPAAGFYPCHPDKHLACIAARSSAKKKAAYELPAGKRCHPDPTRSLGCVENLQVKAKQAPAKEQTEG